MELLEVARQQIDLDIDRAVDTQVLERSRVQSVRDEVHLEGAALDLVYREAHPMHCHRPLAGQIALQPDGHLDLHQAIFTHTLYTLDLAFAVDVSGNEMTPEPI